MKILKFVMLSSVILVYSCAKKQENLVSKETLTNSAAIKFTLNAKTTEIQKGMYNLLTPEEKSEIWNQKFSNYLIDNDLNREQRKFVEELRQIATPNFFDPTQISFKNSINENKIRINAMNLFGVDGAFILLNSISNKKDFTPFDATPSGDCSCSRTSDWCGSYTICRAWICTNTSSGCGTMWSYSCNGSCQTTSQ
jgi:hypothetical protein